MTVRDCRMIFIIGQTFQWKFHHANYSSFPLNYYLSNFHINLKNAHKCSPIGLFSLFGGLKTIDKRRCLPLALPGLIAKARRKRESKNKKQETKRFSTFAVYRLRHSETKEKKHCLIRESCFSGTCAKQPINNISEVTWLCTWFQK